MKSLVILSAVLTLALAEYYNLPIDTINVEAVVTNPVILKQTINCFLDKAPCKDSASKYFKKIFPNLTKTACAKCSPAQKHLVKRFFEELKSTYPKDMKAFKNKYDPKSKYMDALTTALNVA